MHKYVKRSIGGGVFILVVAGLALPKLSTPDGTVSAAAGGGGGGGPMEVAGYVAMPSMLEDRIVTTGTLRANEAVGLASEVSGKITHILFREGTRVEKGQLLLKINDAELVAQRDRILYRLRLAEDRVKRQEALLERGGISQEEFDQTQNELNVLRAELQLNQAQLDKTEVRAPFDGVLGLREVSEGGYISPQSPIATLQDISPIKIDFTIPERHAARVRPGSELVFRVAGRTETFRGRVYAIEPRIDENTRSLLVRATSPNTDYALFPGAFADVELVIEEHENVLAVPNMAVIPELQGRKVFIVRNGRVEQRSVETGIRTPTTVQILSGISPQDTVLTSGLLQVRPGMPVSVVVTREFAEE
jgi:membrane fusion protein, multidrug efflux system